MPDLSSRKNGKVLIAGKWYKQFKGMPEEQIKCSICNEWFLKRNIERHRKTKTHLKKKKTKK